jgi:hypothetical protein
MTSEVPSYDSRHPSDEPKKLEVPPSMPKVAFQGPQDCKWPFMHHDSDSNT